MQEAAWKKSVVANADVLFGRSVFAIEQLNTEKGLCKAGFLVQGQKYEAKNLLDHDFTNLRQSSPELNFAIAAILEYRVSSQDEKQAYMESVKKSWKRKFILSQRRTLHCQKMSF